MFQIITALGLGTGVLGAWLIWRARQVVAPVPACCGAPEAAPEAAPPPTIAGMLARALDYLRTRREWRYQRQWVMLIGEAGAGKSSVAASVAGRYRHPAQGRERQLAVRGCDWQLLDSGCLIDAPGAWMQAAANGERGTAAREWTRVLDELDALRPERALDGLLLVVSARTLQGADLAQRSALASAIRQQLRLLQERFAFCMPVYVLVSNTDAVSGFGAFWRSQPASRRAEMFGWSAPTQADNGTPAAWADAAFDSVGQQLKVLQMNAAAHCERIAPGDTDATFLFARHLQQLRVPLAHWLGIVFQAESWQAGYFCRGIYFTGAVGGSGDAPAAQDGARADLAFVDGLLVDKVLAEPLLARPTRHGVWSRDRILRAMQIGAIASLLALVFAQCIAAIGIERKVEAVVAALAQMRQLDQPLAAPATGACVGPEPVFQVLERIAALDTGTRHWSIPLSLLDNRVTDGSARRLADGPFRNVVLPALACQLRQRAADALATIAKSHGATGATYTRSQAALFAYIEQIEQLERNVMRYNRLGGSAPFAAGELPLAEFTALAEYAFRTPLPAGIKARAGVLPAVLKNVRDGAALAMPRELKHQASAHIAQQAGHLHAQLDQELKAGGELVRKLQRYDEPVLANTREFTRWLTWVRSAWLGSSLEHNPIALTRVDLAARLAPLSRLYGYPEAPLNAASARFDAAARYPAAMAMLRGLQLPSYGTLFVNDNGTLVLNPALASELAGLNALMALDFMQVGRADGFACNPALTGWSASQIGMATTYAQEYDRFASKQGLPALNGDTAARPLYDRLARHQLELVLNDNVQLAQLTQPAASAGRDAALDYGMPADLRQDQESAGFAKLLQPILGLQRVYADKGMGSAGKFAQCVRGFAARNLGQIQLLAEQSQLYQPASNSAGAASRDAPFFDLGSAPETRDYLARQSDRAQVLVRYATPFVNYLVNSGTPSAVPLANTDSQAYWVNTIDELNRYAQKDPNSQVAQLDALFSKILPDLSGTSCGQSLAAYKSPETGNDLFSLRRRQLEKQIDLRCKGARSAQGYDAYKPWAARFNHELAGRYPFAALTGADSQAATVRRFFTDYAAGRADLRQKLAGLNDKYWDDARAFLNQLDAAAAFFDGTLVPSAADPAAPAVAVTASDAATPAAGDAIRLSVTFRARPDDSPASNQITGWRLTSGGMTSALPNRVATVDWRYGQPLSAGFDWAIGSLLRPLKDDHQPDLRVEGRLATFSAGGDWALLRMIELHRPANAAGADEKRSLLEFRVPVVSDDTRYNQTRASASLFLGLAMNAGKKPAAMTLPGAFPRLAPQ